MQTLIILGRQPELGLAELESLYSNAKIQLIGSEVALLNIPASDINFERIGGTMKLAEVISTNPSNDLSDQLLEAIHKYEEPTGKKINIGLSFYNSDISAKKVGALALNLKSRLKSDGYNVRIIPNREAKLNTAQVLHNKLTKEHSYELIIANNNHQIVVARTIAVQDIQSYTIRDRFRPKRDTYVGMLPPKLAQIIINLASGEAKPQTRKLLDPFCGTGVILQEASLMGFSVIGTDIATRMIDYSKVNLDWLKQRWPALKPDVKLYQADARNGKWTNVDLVAGETYLGRPLNYMPDITKLNSMINEVNDLHKEFLANIVKQVASGTRFCLAVPAWRSKNGFKHLPVLDQLDKLGYNRVVFEHSEASKLIYHRPDQLVARELIILIRK